MKSEVDKLTEAPGILAAAKTEGGQTHIKVVEGDEKRWEPLLRAGRQMLDISEDDEVRIILNTYTIVVVRSGGLVLGVVVLKAHPVVKSLKRMLRRAFKRLGNSVPAAPRRAPSIERSATVVSVGPSTDEGGVPTAPLPDASTSKIDL